MLFPALASAPAEGGGTTMVQMMATVGVLLLCFTSLVLLRRKLRRQSYERGISVRDRIQNVREEAMSRSQRQSRSTNESPRVSAAARASVESVMADAEELTRRLAAIMDNKAAKLEILIQQASEAADRLERAGAGATGQPEQHPQAARRQPLTDPLAAEIYSLADQGRTPLDIARELDEPTGKVELILALRPRPAATPASN